MSTSVIRRPKFQTQKKIADFTRKIPQVIETTACPKHFATEGMPCWTAPWGVCDERARTVFNGIPSERNRSTAKAAERASKEQLA